MSLITRRFIVLAICLVFLLSGCSRLPEFAIFVTEPPAQSKAVPAGQTEAQIISSEIKEKTTEATLTVVGDIMLHNNMIASGRSKNNIYNFDTFFSEVDKPLSSGDYTIANLEVPLAGAKASYTGYPRFNAPDEIAKTLHEAGFDLITTANNHILDKGYNGASRTIRVLQQAGLDTVGGVTETNKQQKTLLKDINGIKFAFLAYTYSTNGLPVPKGKEYIVNILDKDTVLKDIYSIKDKADIVVLLLHWGTEYKQAPSKRQQEMAQAFLEAGADIIFGGHPHVLQPAKKTKVNGEDKLVVYSLGNFIASQNGLERNSGVVLNVTLEKDITSGISKIKAITYTPTYSHAFDNNRRKSFRVISVKEALYDLDNNQEKVLQKKDIPILKKIIKDTDAKFSEVAF